MEETDMTEHAIDHLAVSRGARHRRALLTLGMGGLAAALAGTSATAAKQGAGKKRKKRKKQCKRLEQSCVDRVRNYCAGFGDDAAACEEDLLHCCDNCDVGAGIICVMEGIAILQ